MKIRSSINLPWGHVRYYETFGPGQFSRFDVYWRQTNNQTDRQAKYVSLIFSVSKICLLQNSIFEHFENPRIFILFCFTIFTKRSCLQWKWKMGAKRPHSLLSIYILSFSVCLSVCLSVCIQ